MLKIKFGSVFDDKCDLLILPCNDQGGVTGWVRHEIEQHHLPFWKQKIPHGEVFFSTVQTLYEKADCVGYAASVSVATGCASLEAIARITQRIVGYFWLASSLCRTRFTFSVRNKCFIGALFYGYVRKDYCYT